MSAITAAQAKEFDIKKCLVHSNDGATKSDIGVLITDLYYFEDLLSPTLKVDILFGDTGTVQKGGEFKNAVDALQMVGTEKVDLILTDPNDEEIKVTLYTDAITPVAKENRKSLVSVTLGSKESIMNYKTTVNYRLNGRISDSIKTILEDTLKVDGNKKLDIEETSNNLNHIGNNMRPFATILQLARKAVPQTSNAEGNTAGFFFFETSDGYKFKSVEGLLSPVGKEYKSLVYNETPDGRGSSVPPEYGGKILEYNVVTPSGSVQSKLQIGTYSTRTIMFDPFNCYYEVITPSVLGDKGAESKLQKAGKNLPKYNKEFNQEGNNQDYSRTQYMLIDTGTLPTGDGIGKDQQQITKSTTKNFDPKNVLNQSVMRYNQFFSTKVEITITGDFSFHAGDYIFIDAPETSTKDTKVMDKQFGGFYVIAKLCHYISLRSGGYTKLTLCRDSTGRKGSPKPL